MKKPSNSTLPWPLTIESRLRKRSWFKGGKLNMSRLNRRTLSTRTLSIISSLKCKWTLTWSRRQSKRLRRIRTSQPWLQVASALSKKKLKRSDNPMTCFSVTNQETQLQMSPHLKCSRSKPWSTSLWFLSPWCSAAWWTCNGTHLLSLRRATTKL